MVSVHFGTKLIHPRISPHSIKLSSLLPILYFLGETATSTAAPGFTCGVCNKTFLTMELLLHHSRVHQVEDLSSICKECGRDLEPNHNPLFGGKCLICFAKTNTETSTSASLSMPTISENSSVPQLENYHQHQTLLISRLAHLMNLTRSGV